MINKITGILGLGSNSSGDHTRLEKPSSDSPLAGLAPAFLRQEELRKDLSDSLSSSMQAVGYQLPSNQKREKNASSARKLPFRFPVAKAEEKGIEWNLGPGGAVGAGCGAGLGLAVTGGAGFGPEPWDALRLVYGLGFGCGIGVGYGFGFGFGVRWDKPPDPPAPKRIYFEI